MIQIGACENPIRSTDASPTMGHHGCQPNLCDEIRHQNLRTAPQHTSTNHFIETRASISLNSTQNPAPRRQCSGCMDKPEETHRSVGVRVAQKAPRCVSSDLSIFLSSPPTRNQTPTSLPSFAISHITLILPSFSPKLAQKKRLETSSSRDWFFKTTAADQKSLPRVPPAPPPRLPPRGAPPWPPGPPRWPPNPPNPPPRLVLKS